MTVPPKILIAADASLCAHLCEEFAREPEFALLGADSPALAVALAQREKPDLLLLADDFGSFGAQTLVAAARAAGFCGPAILLAAKEEEAPPGIDERLPRPFRFTELLSRVRARLDESREAGRLSEVAIGPFRFRPESQRMTGPGGAAVRLTEKEAAILGRLARQRGAVAPREALLRDVWGYNPAVTTRTLETHIHRLRRKIEADPARPRLLVTESGGYRLASGD